MLERGNCDVDVLMSGSIAPAISLKNCREKLPPDFSSFSSTGPLSTLDIFSTVLLSLILLTKTAKKKILFARVRLFARNCGLLWP